MSFHALKTELPPMTSLAVPVAVGELGWMAMGVVDVMMVGRLSAEAIGAVAVGRALAMVVTVFGIGLLLGMDTLVSQSFGAGDRDDCRHSLVNGVYLAALASVPLCAILFAVIPALGWFGIDPSVRALAAPYTAAVAWSVLPVLLYTALRRYLQAINRVRAVMIALISANLINVASNWILIFGNLGAPEMGVSGAGWATVISMIYLTLFLAGVVWLNEREQGGGTSAVVWRFDTSRLRGLLALGLPAATHVTVELAVFALVTLLAGRLDPASLAAHQIAITLASVTFMVPLGISSAAAVRVGQAIGRRDPPGAVRAGWTAIVLAAGFMALAAAAFVLLPGPLLRMFSSDPEVIEIGVTLLILAALFQLFDGVQVAATGALRGIGDTRNPLIWNLVGHWLIGLPAGSYLCFVRGWGAAGLWVGFCLGLTFVGLVLLRVWSRGLGPMAEPATASPGGPAPL
jgi:MATE family multidrug resistance protein